MTLVTHRSIPLSATGTPTPLPASEVAPVLFVHARKDPDEPPAPTAEADRLARLERQVEALLANDAERADALANIADGLASLLDLAADIRDRLDP